MSLSSRIARASGSMDCNCLLWAHCGRSLPIGIMLCLWHCCRIWYFLPPRFPVQRNGVLSIRYTCLRWLNWHWRLLLVCKTQKLITNDRKAMPKISRIPWYLAYILSFRSYTGLPQWQLPVLLPLFKADAKMALKVDCAASHSGNGWLSTVISLVHFGFFCSSDRFTSQSSLWCACLKPPSMAWVPFCRAQVLPPCARWYLHGWEYMRSRFVLMNCKICRRQCEFYETKGDAFSRFNGFWVPGEVKRLFINTSKIRWWSILILFRVFHVECNFLFDALDPRYFVRFCSKTRWSID